VGEAEDRARVELLAQKVRELAAVRRTLQNESAAAFHRYHLGLMDPFECGNYIEGRGQLAKRIGEAEEAWRRAYADYDIAVQEFFRLYVHDKQDCRFIRSFTYGVGYRD
jgi:hypothetical protein